MEEREQPRQELPDKCPYRIEYENWKAGRGGTTFEGGNQRNPLLDKCENCNGHDMTCDTYIGYLVTFVFKK